MKKVILICLISVIMLAITGCSSVNNMDIDTIINNSLKSKVKNTTNNKSGYSYYLPKGLIVVDTNLYNDIITDHKYNYYLFVDVVSFNSKINFDYKKNNEAYYSNLINFQDKKGYIEINKYKNEQYLIEIMYNYAKIEVIVMEKDINKSVAFAISLLTSVTYNDSVISKNLSNSTLDFNEEKFDIFEIVGSDNYLQFGGNENQEEIRKDPDYVK